MLHRELKRSGLSPVMLKTLRVSQRLKSHFLFFSMSLTMMLADDAAMLAMLFF